MKEKIEKRTDYLFEKMQEIDKKLKELSNEYKATKDESLKEFAKVLTDAREVYDNAFTKAMDDLYNLDK